MTWNVIIHILLGFLGTELFTFTLSGLVYCFAFVSLTQGSETFRLYRDRMKELAESGVGEEAKNRLQREMLQTFMESFLLQSCIVLFAAEVARMSGMGL